MAQGSGAYRHLVLLWVFILSFDAYVGAGLWMSYRQAHQQALQLATSYVRLVEEQASASFDRANLVLRQVAALLKPEELRDGMVLPASRRDELQAAMSDIQHDGHGIVSMTVTDVDGRVVANSLGALAGGSLGDRDYFLALRDGTSPGPVVSRLIKGRVSQKWGIQVARALQVEGRFAGMVVANVGLIEYLSPFWQSLLLPPSSVVSLRDLDHRLMVRSPLVEEMINTQIVSPEVDRSFISGQTEGSYRRVSPIDEVARVVVFRKLERYPLYATVALADRDSLATWRGNANRSAFFLVLISVGGVLATVGVRRRDRLERQARENADKLAVALRAAHAVTWHWDVTSDRLEWSGDVAALYGGGGSPRTLGEWLRQLPDEDRVAVEAEIRRVRATRAREYRIEYRLVDSQGRLRWMTGMGMVSFDPDETMQSAFGVNIDISAVKQAEEQLMLARDEALDAKAEAERASLARSKFLAAASHDLRQPVQSLLLLIEVMKIRLVGSPMEQVTAQMEHALDGLRLLLNSLLDMSKLDAGVVVPAMDGVNLGQLLDRLAEEYRIRAAERGLEFRLVRTSQWLVSDAALVERLLRNLIENAIRYTPAGRVVVGCRRVAGGVGIVVADTGIGIAHDQHEAVFEEFHQVANSARDRSQGLGLGLAIVRRLAGLLGGRIELQSDLGRGCRFTVHLPFQPPPSPPPSPL